MKKTEFDNLVAWGKRHYDDESHVLSFDTICFLPDGDTPENVVGRDGDWTCLHWLNFGNNDNDELRRRTHQLEVTLHGNEDLQKIWNEAERTNVTPNIPEPEPGLIETIAIVASSLHTAQIDASKVLTLEAKVRTLEATVSQQGIEQPATKAYVDEAIAKFSQVIYEKLGAIEKWIQTLEGSFADQHETLETARFWSNEYRKDAERPSRVQSLIHAVTGNAPRPRA